MASAFPIRFPLAAAMLAAMGSSARTCDAGECVPNLPLGAAVVSLEQVPEVAQRSIVDASNGSRIDGVHTFEEAGTRMYLARTISGGRATGVEVSAAGAVQSVHTRLADSELPGPVKRTADAETGTYPERQFWRKDADGARTYVVHATSRVRAKRVEIAGDGELVRSEFVNA